MYSVYAVDIQMKGLFHYIEIQDIRYFNLYSGFLKYVLWLL